MSKAMWRKTTATAKQIEAGECADNDHDHHDALEHKNMNSVYTVRKKH